MLAELLELAPGGVEEATLADGTVEYAVYGAPGEVPELPALRAAAGGALVEVRSEQVADDWQERWRKFHKPLVIDRSLAVRPPWEPEQGTSIDVVIDPGRAFGTGAHATTRLCLEAMMEISRARRKTSARPGPLVDLGCGSGVLAIAAAKLGWAPVRALDFDPAAIEATRENVARNAVDVETACYDLRSDPVDPALAPTVVANLLAPLLIAWACRLGPGARRLESSTGALPERVIASGLPVGEGDRVAREFAALGLREAKRLARGDWLALVLER